MEATKKELTLKEWRSRKRWNQDDAARKIGIAPSTYNIWENNPEKIRPQDAFKIADAFEISIDEILFLKDKSYFKYVIVEDELAK